MDGDGNPDLLMQGEDYLDEGEGLVRTLAPEIGYGNGQGGFEWLKMPEDMGWYSRGTVDVDGDGDLDWVFSSDKLAILQGREILRVQAVPDGQLVDLDGLPGAELLSTRGIGPGVFGTTEFPRIQVWKLGANGVWELFADYDVPDFWPQIAPQTAAAVVGNFDGDAEPDILVPVVGSRAVMLGLTPSGLVLDGAPDWVSGLKKDEFVTVVKGKAGGLDSLMIQSSAMTADAFGNPVSVGPAHWKRSDVSLVAGYLSLTAPVMVSPFHDPRSFAVVKMGDVPKLASLGGDDRTLSVWADLSGPAARRVIGEIRCQESGWWRGTFKERGPKRWHG